MSKGLKLNGKNINVRISGALDEAIETCAEDVGERKSVFIRTAVVNRLTELGIYTFGPLDADPWMESDTPHQK